MASSGLLEIVILTSIMLTTDGTIGCVKSNTWCQMVWHLIVSAGPHTYHCCKMLTQAVHPPVLCATGRGCGPSAMGKLSGVGGFSKWMAGSTLLMCCRKSCLWISFWMTNVSSTYLCHTFVIQMEIHKQDFLQHINSVDPAIQFTVENNKEDGAIPLLDTIVKPEADGNLSITVYWKPTQMDQYLQWDSHHHLSAKFSVIHTFTHRAQTVYSNPELLHKEKSHLRKALIQCKYPKWALEKVEKRLNKPSREATDEANNQGTTGAQPTTNEVKTKGHIVIPYTQGLCESIKKIYGRYGIQTHFKGSNTIRKLLVSPKDKDPMVRQSGATYWFQCGDLTCDDE